VPAPETTGVVIALVGPSTPRSGAHRRRPIRGSQLATVTVPGDLPVCPSSSSSWRTAGWTWDSGRRRWPRRRWPRNCSGWTPRRAGRGAALLRGPVRRAGRRAGRGAAAARRGGAGPGVQPVRDRAVPLGRLPPTLYSGTVESIRAAVDLVAQQRCVLCAPSSCVSPPAGIVWKPVFSPPSHYPWSVLWRAGDSSEHVNAFHPSRPNAVPAARLAATTRPGGRLTEARSGGCYRRP